MAATLDASTSAVTGALTVSVLAGAVWAVPVGRWLDRHGGRALMTAGSLLATVLVVAWSQVDTVAQLYAVQVGIGVTTAMVLYEPTLAVVVSWFPAELRARAVLGVIAVAGFVSTIFMPLTGVLADRYGWRSALFILAVLYGLVTVPLRRRGVQDRLRSGQPRQYHMESLTRLPAAALLARSGFVAWSGPNDHQD